MPNPRCFHTRGPQLARLFACLFAALTLVGASSAHPAETLLLRDIRAIDPVDGIREPMDLLIRDGRIALMGQNLDAPPAVRIIDGTGRYIMPGLWDMHVHLSYDARLTELMPDLFLDYGITSIRDTGGLLENMLPIVEKLRAPGAIAPRLYFSGPLMDGQPVVYDGGDVQHMGIANPTPEAAVSNIRQLQDAGVDFVKIYEMVSPQVFAALVAAAGNAGLPIAAHVPLSMLVSDAGPQVQSMEHLRNLELDCAANAQALLVARRQMLETGLGETGLGLRSQIHTAQRIEAIQNEDPRRCDTVLASLRHTTQVPTARLNAMTQYPPFKRTDWIAALETLPEAVAKSWRDAPSQLSADEHYRVLGEWTLAMIPRLAQAGVPIGAGTDTPIGWAIPGYSLHSELEILVAAGLSPLAALAAATLQPARFFGLENELGRILPTYRADLLILEANPLDAIANSRRIHAVIADGRMVRAAARPE
ncbi:MAG: hypothetical protein ACI87W_000878 [Halieaceae bacterium]|jgi:hypothetical protein